MRTIIQVAALTGISIRTLQYHDEIGLLKPTELTPSGYRLYDEESLQKLDIFIQKIKDDEDHVAKLAIQQFGSIEVYTKAMKHNLEHFPEIMDNWYAKLPEDMRTEDKFLKLASYREKENAASDNIQNLVREIIAYAHGNVSSELVGDAADYCQMIIDTYSNDYLKRVLDTKYGAGCCSLK